jgi:hypothetical protein
VTIEPHQPHDPVTAAIELLSLLDRWQRLEVLRHFADELRQADVLPGGGMSTGAMVIPERPVPSRFLP